MLYTCLWPLWSAADRRRFAFLCSCFFLSGRTLRFKGSVFVNLAMKPTRQQVLGSLLLAAIVLIIFIVRAGHILFP
jgi:hypothetical protein